MSDAIKKSHPEKGVYIVDKVDWYDFMTNDDNPTLCRMADELLAHPDFKKLFEEEDERTVD